MVDITDYWVVFWTDHPLMYETRGSCQFLQLIQFLGIKIYHLHNIYVD